jgi:hypothetical protein
MRKKRSRQFRPHHKTQRPDEKPKQLAPKKQQHDPDHQSRDRRESMQLGSRNVKEMHRGDLSEFASGGQGGRAARKNGYRGAMRMQDRLNPVIPPSPQNAACPGRGNAELGT